MNNFRYSLGAEATDRVTGFTGFVTGRADYIAGCRQYMLSPPVKVDGGLPDALWFDEERITPTGQKAPQVPATPTGGPSGRERAPSR